MGQGRGMGTGAESSEEGAGRKELLLLDSGQCQSESGTQGSPGMGASEGPAGEDLHRGHPCSPCHQDPGKAWGAVGLGCF